MLSLFWNLSAAINGYMRFYLPTNRAIDWLRTPCGLKWAIPVTTVAVPTYLYSMNICATIVERSGPGWLNLLVLVFFWNAMKFSALGVMRIATLLLKTVGLSWPLSGVSTKGPIASALDRVSL